MRIRIVPAISLSFILMVAASCTREVATVDERPVTPAVTDAATEPTEVHVMLADHTIDMPATIAAGDQTFHIMNQGTEAHNFEIEGNGIEQKLPENLESRQSSVLRVTLPPGEYRVYCPVGNHAERGMEMQLTVQ